MGGWFMDGENKFTVEVTVKVTTADKLMGSGMMTAGDEMVVRFEHNRSRQLVGKLGEEGDIHWSNGRVWKRVA